MNPDNAVIHYYPLSPYIVKAAINLREGEKIVLRICIRDTNAALDYLSRRWPELPARTITHC